MKRDRTGELLDDDVEPVPRAASVQDPPAHDYRCVRGWLGDDPDRPVPCPVCRPRAAAQVSARARRGAA